jgi:predicted dehydrogenase
MLEESRKANRRLFVHHQHRFGALYQQLQSVIASGKLGRVFHVQFRSADFLRRQDWQTLTRLGGGILNNTASHYLDLVLALIDAPVVQAMGDLKQVVSPGDAEDHFKALLRAENGCTADIEVSAAEALHTCDFFWLICGTSGTLTSDGQTVTVKWFDPDRLSPLEVSDAAAAGRQYLNHRDFPWEQSTTAVDESQNLLFYDNVSEVLRTDAPQRVTAESVCEVIRTIELIRQTAGGIWRAAGVGPAPLLAAANA